MKRYLVWILAVYLILLLLPLPLLGATKSDKTPVTVSSSSTPSSSPISSSSSSVPAIENTFRLLDTDTDTLYEVSDRDLVIGTVSAEMYPSYHTEAIKAQAVASYTYYSVLRSKQRASPDEALKGADFADTISGLPLYYNTDQLKERWGDNYASYYKKISEAVDAVFGKLITYDNAPILAVYHAISAGITEDAAVVWGLSYPYLQPTASPGDKLSPSYQSVVTVAPTELSSKLGAAIENFTTSGEPSTWLSPDIQTSSSGTVTQLTICGTALTGRQIREALTLRSACFTVTFEDGNFHFTVMGYGHGVGMSQYGADYLARQGSTWEEILHYYYSGVTIANAT